jgi:hypothetical protein
MVMNAMCNQSGMVANKVYDQVAATEVLVWCYPMEEIVADNKVSDQVSANNKVSDHVGATQVLVRYFPKEAATYLDADNEDDPDYTSANDDHTEIAGVINNNAPIDLDAPVVTGVNDDNNTNGIAGVNNYNAPINIDAPSIAGVNNDNAPIAGVYDDNNTNGQKMLMNPEPMHHVDVLKISHVNPEVVTDVINWLKKVRILMITRNSRSSCATCIEHSTCPLPWRPMTCIFLIAY